MIRRQLNNFVDHWNKRWQGMDAGMRQEISDIGIGQNNGNGQNGNGNNVPGNNLVSGINGHSGINGDGNGMATVNISPQPSQS